LWSAAAQTRCTHPDAHVGELFVLLHGMLFTNIQLDNFQSTLVRLIERLQIEDVEERDWIMMAVINVSSVLKNGKPTGVLRSCVPSVSGSQYQLNPVCMLWQNVMQLMRPINVGGEQIPKLESNVSAV
jgi:hypothetical protein